jgi:hypothetical protein
VRSPLHNTLLFIVLSATCVKAGDFQLTIDMAQAVQLDPCAPADNWVVRNLDPICPGSICALSKPPVSSLPENICTFRGLPCRHLDELGGSLGPGIVLDRPMPEALSINNDAYDALTAQDRAGKPTRFSFAFVPGALAASGSIQPTSISLGGTVLFKPVTVNGSPAFDHGQAFCRYRQLGQATMFDRCTVTSFEKDGLNYVRVIMAIADYAPECARHGEYVQGVRYDLEDTTDRDKLIDGISDEITTGSLALDKSSISLTAGEAKFLIEGFAGPRLSKIDTKQREQIDVSISFTKSAAESYAEAIRVLGWLNPQNTNNPDDWRMPGDFYYGSLRQSVSEAIRLAYSHICSTHNKTVDQATDSAGIRYTCK